jgi:N-acetylneuraminate synthase
MEYMCTPWDHKSIEFLEKLNVERYKVASADFDNIPLIERLIQTKKTVNTVNWDGHI